MAVELRGAKCHARDRNRIVGDDDRAGAEHRAGFGHRFKGVGQIHLGRGEHGRGRAAGVEGGDFAAVERTLADSVRALRAPVQALEPLLQQATAAADGAGPTRAITWSFFDNPDRDLEEVGKIAQAASSIALECTKAVPDITVERIRKKMSGEIEPLLDEVRTA